MKVKISSKGQIAIPARFRRNMKIKAGDLLTIIESGDNLIISTPKHTDKEELEKLIAKLKGAWKDFELDGTDFVRYLREGGTRDVWE